MAKPAASTRYEEPPGTGTSAGQTPCRKPRNYGRALAPCNVRPFAKPESAPQATVVLQGTPAGGPIIAIAGDRIDVHQADTGLSGGDRQTDAPGIFGRRNKIAAPGGHHLPLCRAVSDGNIVTERITHRCA